MAWNAEEKWGNICLIPDATEDANVEAIHQQIRVIERDIREAMIHEAPEGKSSPEFMKHMFAIYGQINRLVGCQQFFVRPNSTAAETGDNDAS